MAVLLLFNDNDKLDYQELRETTNLTDEHLKPALEILCKAKVLLTDSEESKAQPGTSYKLNYNFKNKKLKVNLNVPGKTEQKVEAQDTHKTIEEDRKLLLQVCSLICLPLPMLTILQAVIVRIMKGRKKLKHVHLVEEVITQVKHRFPPKIPDIKKNIDALMEKDYIERLENDELSYIA